MTIVSFRLRAVVKTTERARLPPASGKCKVCKAGGDGLLACSFCTAVYHNSEACLGEANAVSESLAKSASFLLGVPGLLQEGRRRCAAGCAQADGPARCRCQEAAQEARKEVRIGVAWAVR